MLRLWATKCINWPKSAVISIFFAKKSLTITYKYPSDGTCRWWWGTNDIYQVPPSSTNKLWSIAFPTKCWRTLFDSSICQKDSVKMVECLYTKAKPLNTYNQVKWGLTSILDEFFKSVNFTVTSCTFFKIFTFLSFVFAIDR